MHSQIHLSLTTRASRTIVEKLYYSPPMRLIAVGQRERFKNPAYFMITSSSPGMLSGDEYEIHVAQGPNTSLFLRSQAYQQLMDSAEECQQETIFHLHPNATLSYVPHPLVAHKNAKYRARTQVFLEENAFCIIGEIVSAGRKHHRELFAFHHFFSTLEIYHSSELILKDVLYLNPTMDLGAVGLMEGYSHQGSLFVCGQDIKRYESIVGEIVKKTKAKIADATLMIGHSCLAKNGIIVRALAQSGETIYNIFTDMNTEVWQERMRSIELQPHA